jgi:hypothetical protein
MLTGRHFAILTLCAGFGLCCQAVGAEKAAKGTPSPVAAIPPITAEQRQGALFLDALSVPSPGEVFAALNKACRPNWATLVTPATAPVTTDRTQLALAVGVLAANGYIAVEAQDGQQVKNVGREMMAMAKALGVSQSLLGRGHSLVEFADNNAWDALADELEATENEVKATMVEQKDKDLVALTSSAAWLRGLEVASGVVLANENLQGAAVLHQPRLARHLASRLEGLPARMIRGELVPAVTRTLSSTAAILDQASQNLGGQGKPYGKPPQITRENLQKIHDDASVIVKMILTSASAPAPSATPQAGTGTGTAVGTNPASTGQPLTSATPAASPATSSSKP